MGSRGGSDDEDNPFRVPPDDQIFAMREQERKKRSEDRERVKHLRVWEKTTASARIHRTRAGADDEDDAAMAAQVAEASKSSRRVRAEGVVRDPRREKENITDFVAKKREMFLVQMSLDVKKAEILKLDEKGKMKDEALNKSKAMLDEDVQRFDQFLQRNDQQAHGAMKRAEEKTKQKQDRMQKIKQLKSQISAIQSEISKHREQKDECLKFKGFLEKLTPVEFKEQMAARKQERKRTRRAEWIRARMTDINSRMQAEIDTEDRIAEEKVQEQHSRSRRASALKKAEEEAKEREREAEQRRKRIRRKYPTQDQVEAEYVEVSSGEEMPLYFEEPKQLLDVFTSLEESNLFLIQNSQETEQALEEVQQKFTDLRRVMDSKTKKMKADIDELQKKIDDQQRQCEELKTRVSSQGGKTEQDVLLTDLGHEVAEVHGACGFDDKHDPDTLRMLGEIEAKLEEFIAYLDEVEGSADSARLQDLERQKEGQRRARVRLQRKEAMDARIETRLKESLKRSQAPIHKKIGKQIMFRSAPTFQARRVVEEDDGYEDAVREHEIFNIWLNKEGLPNADAPTRTN